MSSHVWKEVPRAGCEVCEVCRQIKGMPSTKDVCVTKKERPPKKTFPKQAEAELKRKERR